MHNADLNWIYSRRSIRVYSAKPVDDEIVTELLKAAMAAPSAVAKDPWHFIVLKDRILREKVSEGLPNGKMLAKAPVGIIVSGDITLAHSNELSYLLQDCSAAIENLLLAAQILGLGACWLGVHPRMDRVEHIKRIFKLPENIIPVSCIAIGYPGEKKEGRTRFDKKKVHVDKWE